MQRDIGPTRGREEGPLTESAENGGKANRQRLFALLRRPIFFVVVNFFFLNTIFAFLPYGLGEFLYTAVRAAIIGYAGWLICRRGIGGVWQAAVVGAAVYFVDHVALKGGVFLMNYLFRPEGMGFAAFGSVLISYLLFAPLAMAIAAAGGTAGRKHRDQAAARP
jgi:hypothetical protein